MLRKISIFSLILGSAVVLSSIVQAAPITILDNYIGGTATNPAWANKDIVGTQDQFDISSMTMDMTGNVLSVQIKSTYFDNVGVFNTHFGDVFLSSNGWNPNGSAPYLNDDAFTGENWEYALVFSTHGENYHTTNSIGTNMIGQSGEAKLVKILNNSDIALSDAPGYIYKAGQEVSVVGDSLNEVVSTGGWSIFQDENGYSVLSVSASLLGSNLLTSTNIGAHFGFSCGNDVIEGAFNTSTLASSSVPEPQTMILLAMSLMGVSSSKSKRRLRRIVENLKD